MAPAGTGCHGVLADTEVRKDVYDTRSSRLQRTQRAPIPVTAGAGARTARPVSPSRLDSWAQTWRAGGFQESLSPVNWGEVKSESPDGWLSLTVATQQVTSCPLHPASTTGFGPGRELPGGPPSLGWGVAGLRGGHDRASPAWTPRKATTLLQQPRAVPGPPRCLKPKATAVNPA